MIGILQSRSLWATNIRFLNDATEFQLALDLLDELLEQKVEAASSRYDRALYSVLKESLSEAGDSEVYVASFSEDGDQLGQWRAYSPAASGYAVGITRPFCGARKVHQVACSS
ncbi:MAG: hypothetical protein ABR543_04055 [Gemmatimonadaceae bacterium]